MNSVIFRTFRNSYIRLLYLESLKGGAFLKYAPKAISLARYSMCATYKPNLQCVRNKYTKNKQYQSAEVNK
jgi:hypothetical protein